MQNSTMVLQFLEKGCTWKTKRLGKKLMACMKNILIWEVVGLC